MTALFGIDTARWQGVVDFRQAANAGFAFAWIKATHGATGIDERLHTNVENAAKAGVPWGLYHWHQPGVLPEAQVTHLAKTVEEVEDRHGPMRLPIAVDFEEQCKLNPGLLLTHIEWLISLVIARTYWTPILYTGKWYWEVQKLPDSPKLARLPLWHAEYPYLGCKDLVCAEKALESHEPHVAAPWASRGIPPTIWQFDGDHGLALPNGVDVDVNVFRGDVTALLAWADGRRQRSIPPQVVTETGAPATAIGAAERREWDEVL